MNKEEVENNILGKYPSFIERLKNLIDLCLSKVQVISNQKPDWITNNDARYAIYGKYVSVLNATRISIYNTLHFINQKDWVETYNSEFSIGGQTNNFVYLKELDTQLRFANYMSFVSNFESSLKIIIRFLKQKKERCASSYASFVIDNLKIKTHDDFLRMVKHLRNTIHNNGIHIPDNSIYNNDHINFKGLDFNFQRNKRVELQWTDCFNIYEEIINLTEQIIKEDIVAMHKLIKDIVVES